jgi:hypothetical protein
MKKNLNNIYVTSSTLDDNILFIRRMEDNTINCNIN